MKARALRFAGWAIGSIPLVTGYYFGREIGLLVFAGMGAGIAMVILWVASWQEDRKDERAWKHGEFVDVLGIKEGPVTIYRRKG